MVENETAVGGSLAGMRLVAAPCPCLLMTMWQPHPTRWQTDAPDSRYFLFGTHLNDSFMVWQTSEWRGDASTFTHPHPRDAKIYLAGSCYWSAWQVAADTEHLLRYSPFITIIPSIFLCRVKFVWFGLVINWVRNYLAFASTITTWPTPYHLRPPPQK